MKTFVRGLLCILLLSPSSTSLLAGAQQGSTTNQERGSGSSNPQSTLEDGTPVKLRTTQTVSSADAQVNDRVEFEVLEDVRVADTMIIPKGGIAWGTVTEAQSKRRMGRAGKLEIVMDSVRLVDGEKAALRATKEAQGGGHTGAMTVGIVATALVFWPAAPLFLLVHGKDITIPKGTEVPTFINGNLPLDMAKFRQGAPESHDTFQASVSAAGVAAATVSITSTPAGAEISIDQNFVGNTPSSIGVAGGMHVVSITKSGFQNWERKITVSGGNVNLSADLTPTAGFPTSQSTASSTATSVGKPSVVLPPARTNIQQGPKVEGTAGGIGVVTKEDRTIAKIVEGSAAANAGLKVGDTILELNGAPVKSGEEFDAAIARCKPGSQARITYIRGAWKSDITLTVDEIR